VAHRAEGRHGIRRDARDRVAPGATRGEARRVRRGVRRSRERYGVAHSAGTGGAVAQRAVEASGGRSRRGRRGRVVCRVVRGPRKVALRADRRVFRVRIYVGVGGTEPGPGRVRRVHPVAGEARHLRPAAGEAVPVADLAGGEAGAAGGLFRGEAVVLRRGKGGDPAGGDRTMMAVRRVSEAGNLRGPSGEVRTVAFNAGNASIICDVGMHGGLCVPAAGWNHHPIRRVAHAARGLVVRAPCDPCEGGQEDQRQRRMPKNTERMDGDRHLSPRSYRWHCCPVTSFLFPLAQPMPFECIQYTTYNTPVPSGVLCKHGSTP